MTDPIEQVFRRGLAELVRDKPALGAIDLERRDNRAIRRQRQRPGQPAADPVAAGRCGARPGDRCWRCRLARAVARRAGDHRRARAAARDADRDPLAGDPDR